MTAEQLFLAIGDLPDSVVALAEPGTKLPRIWRWGFIAALIAALVLTVAALGARYGWIPGFGVVQTYAPIYYNADPVSFTQSLPFPGGRTGQSTLTHVIASEDEVTILIEGEFLECQNLCQTGTSVLTEEPLENVQLIVGQTSYQTKLWRCSFFKDSHYEQVYVFSVPTNTLQPEIHLELHLGQPGETPVCLSFSLKAVDTIQDLSDIGTVAESELFDLAAEAKQTADGVDIRLYSINRTGMELVCYGVGKGYERVEFANHDALRLETGDTIYYDNTCTESSAIPRTLHFADAELDGTVLKVPFVVLRQAVDIQIDQQFCSREEALAYRKSIEVPYGVLYFSVEEDADGNLDLVCQITRNSNCFRIVGMERANSVFRDWVIPDKGDTVILDTAKKLANCTELNQNLHLSIQIPAITYAFITDFTLSMVP